MMDKLMKKKMLQALRGPAAINSKAMMEEKKEKEKKPLADELAEVEVETPEQEMERKKKLQELRNGR